MSGPELNWSCVNIVQKNTTFTEACRKIPAHFSKRKKKKKSPLKFEQPPNSWHSLVLVEFHEPYRQLEDTVISATWTTYIDTSTLEHDNKALLA